jgi:hypothetical protein
LWRFWDQLKRNRRCIQLLKGCRSSPLNVVRTCCSQFDGEVNAQRN